MPPCSIETRARLLPLTYYQHFIRAAAKLFVFSLLIQRLWDSKRACRSITDHNITLKGWTAKKKEKNERHEKDKRSTIQRRLVSECPLRGGARGWSLVGRWRWVLFCWTFPRTWKDKMHFWLEQNGSSCQCQFQLNIDCSHFECNFPDPAKNSAKKPAGIAHHSQVVDRIIANLCA